MTAFTFSRRQALQLVAAVSVLAARPGFAAAAPLKIGTIGGGNIGKVLGSVWAKHGHEVMLSSRHPEELNDFVAVLGPNASNGTVKEAIAFGDVILLGVPYSAVPDIAKEFGPALAKKALLFDASNPIVPRDGAVGDAARAKGAGDYLLGLIPGARIVRGFNAMGAPRFGQGGLRDDKHLAIPLAGDDKKALAIASDLVRETGYEPVVVGSLTFGKYLMPGTPMAGEHTADEFKKIAATLK